jgi:thiamine pyrophosphokinase
MTLPSKLKTYHEWTLIGPMGPDIPAELTKFPILGVDAGAQFSPRLDVWVGDGDSCQTPIPNSVIYKHPVDKDQSDLALALGLFEDKRHYKLHLWGFLGGRRDHELFNIGEAMSFLEGHQECQIIFYGPDGKIYFHLVAAGLWKFDHLGIFSLGTLKRVCLKLTGECKYPINKMTAMNPLSSFGLSNMGQGNMTLESQGPSFIYYPEGK